MDERGFTLIELLVVVLVIGILAAIALPTFLGQSDKARDADAKSDLRNAVSQMESCFSDEDLYDGCPDAQTQIAASVDVELTPDNARYTLTRESKSGTEFTITRLTTGYDHGCDRPGEAGCAADSTW